MLLTQKKLQRAIQPWWHIREMELLQNQRFQKYNNNKLRKFNKNAADHQSYTIDIYA